MSKDFKNFHRADEARLLDDRGYSGELIRGENPALLFEKAVRERITDSYYWKEQCFGLNEATLCDRAAQLKYIGGTYGGMGKPTPFLCLAFKMIQLVPRKNIILEYLNFSSEEHEGDDSDDEIKKEGEGGGGVPDPQAGGKRGEFKYLRALAAFYIRLAWSPVEIYTTLEPLLSDYRKLKQRRKETFVMTYIDQFVDDLLTKDRVCGTALWRLPKRENLEDLDQLEPYVSPLADEIEAMDAEDDDGDVQMLDGPEDGRARSDSDYSRRSRSWSRSRSSDYDRRRRRSRSSDYDRRSPRRSSSRDYSRRSRSRGSSDYDRRPRRRSTSSGYDRR